jgi:hypothetical protein
MLLDQPRDDLRVVDPDDTLEGVEHRSRPASFLVEVNAAKRVLPKQAL